ncbi:MlaD family protein [Rurimicrobium arvi]|uniref:MlaD family protein n=1 Tax=Rurimicrobium arvi TaxID=2049916 RepID=A0ABP8MII8_9BACT
MALSKEAKTGLMVAISIAVIAVGTYYLKGFNLFSSEKKYYCYFDNVEGLAESSTVQVKGKVVGNVTRIILQGNDKVKVEIGVSKKVQLPQGTVAAIFSPDLMSAKSLKLELGNSSTILNAEAEIPTKIIPGPIDKITGQLDPIMTNAGQVILRLDSVMLAIQTVLDAETQQNLHQSMASLETTMRNFASLSASLNRESAQLAGVIRNANSITANIARNSDNIDGIMTNLRSTTDKLSKAELDQMVNKLEQTLNETQILMGKINRGEGSLGMMANDKQLYNNLSSSLTSLDKLLDDLKKHPSRYINIRLFGRAPKDNP